jgi:hypothetical protein
MSGVLPQTADLASFGGLKSNSTPVVDPTTDEDADDRNKAFANAAAATHVVWRAWCSFLGSASGPVDPSSHVHDSVWGASITDKPVVTRIALGHYRITWPTTITDQKGDNQTLNLRRAWAIPGVDGASEFPVSFAKVTAANQVDVWIYNGSSAPPAASDMVASTITVFAI